MSPKLTIGVIFGGRSGEHEVSLQSASSILQALDPDKYDIVMVGITKEGVWLSGGNPLQALKEGKLPGDCRQAVLFVDPRRPGLMLLGEEGTRFVKLDLVFPILHGPFGEDGTIQGLLEMAGLPYVGAGVLGSAAGMDKVIMKNLFRQNGLPVGDFLFFKAFEWQRMSERIMEEIEDKLGYPCFVKPANLGSSVGITRAVHRQSLREGIAEALKYDLKVIVEAFIPGREIECSILGNDDPIASVPGEIKPCNEFYDYRAKYIDGRSELIIPAPLDESLVKEVQELAKRAFKSVDCSGLARVDFFVDDDRGEVTINEINTMPGFTEISMYPKLWEASGISYSELLDRLIGLAQERWEQRRNLRYKS